MSQNSEGGDIAGERECVDHVSETEETANVAIISSTHYGGRTSGVGKSCSWDYFTLRDGDSFCNKCQKKVTLHYFLCVFLSFCAAALLTYCAQDC